MHWCPPLFQKRSCVSRIQSETRIRWCIDAREMRSDRSTVWRAHSLGGLYRPLFDRWTCVLIKRPKRDSAEKSVGKNKKLSPLLFNDGAAASARVVIRSVLADGWWQIPGYWTTLVGSLKSRRLSRPRVNKSAKFAPLRVRGVNSWWTRVPNRNSRIYCRFQLYNTRIIIAFIYSDLHPHRVRFWCSGNNRICASFGNKDFFKNIPQYIRAVALRGW